MKVLANIGKVERATVALMKQCSGYTFNTDKAIRHLRAYAVNVFGWQLSHYLAMPEFSPNWSSVILEETITIIMGAIPRGTQSLLPNDKSRIRNEIRKTLTNHLLMAQSKRQKTAESALAIKASTPAQLRIQYFALFPTTKVLDVCWAAAQRYSEWKRWLREVLKSDSAPDRAFRAILTSGKKPGDYRKQPRPSGWK
ncbi:MAG: hypothetical protein ABSB15_08330 [Bryobacteraceae bacterium]|jgi:hypothetical protein